MTIETVKELKQLILTHYEESMSSEAAKEKLIIESEVLASSNPIFAMNKQLNYNIIATNLGLELKAIGGASSSTKAFPLKIKELSTSEKINFDIAGYIVKPVFAFNTANDNEMLFVTLADDTSVTTFSTNDAFADNSKIHDLDLEVGDYVKVSNLSWKDKTKFSPSYGKYSSIVKAEPEFDLESIKAIPITSLVHNANAQRKSENYYTIKGIVVRLGDMGVLDAYHCSGGHWFKGLNDSNVGEMSMCSGDKKCDKPMEVFKSVSAQDVVFADETGIVGIEVSTFAGLKSLAPMDQLVISGEYRDDDVFAVRDVLVIKKN